MRAIVASRYSVEIIDFVTEERWPLRLFGEDLLYYGITWSDEYMFLSRRHILTNDQSIERFDLNFGARVILHNEEMLHEFHQVQWHDGRLYIANSGYDEILICDENGENIERWHPIGKTSADTRHLNSIWFGDDKIYILAHNRGPSDVLVFNEYQQLVEHHRRGVAAHNVAVIDGEIVVLSSSEALVSIGQRSQLLTGANTYPRGLAVTDDHIFVGLSEHCNYREERHRMTKGAVEVYSRDWEHEQTFELTKGMVHEVRILDEPDYAHHGQVWQGVMG